MFSTFHVMISSIYRIPFSVFVVAELAHSTERDFLFAPPGLSQKNTHTHTQRNTDIKRNNIKHFPAVIKQNIKQGTPSVTSKRKTHFPAVLGMIPIGLARRRPSASSSTEGCGGEGTSSRRWRWVRRRVSARKNCLKPGKTFLKQAETH